MKTLFISDLDGTLLNGNEKLSQYTVNTINELVEKGMNFSYATARSFVSASTVTHGLKIKTPVIIFNGTFIIDPLTGKRLESFYFSESEIEYIKNILVKYSVNPLVYSEINNEERVSWIESAENQGIKNYKARRRGDKRLRPVDNPNKQYQGNVFYYMCIGGKAELQKIYNHFTDYGKFTCTFQKDIYDDYYICEIYSREASKGNAVIKLKEMLKCGRIVSFGDAVNDIPMFAVSDECYAVENAVPELKKTATGTIRSNEENGVAFWLEENYRKYE